MKRISYPRIRPTSIRKVDRTQAGYQPWHIHLVNTPPRHFKACLVHLHIWHNVHAVFTDSCLIRLASQAMAVAFLNFVSRKQKCLLLSFICTYIDTRRLSLCASVISTNLALVSYIWVLVCSVQCVHVHRKWTYFYFRKYRRLCVGGIGNEKVHRGHVCWRGGSGGYMNMNFGYADPMYIRISIISYMYSLLLGVYRISLASMHSNHHAALSFAVHARTRSVPRCCSGLYPLVLGVYRTRLMNEWMNNEWTNEWILYLYLFVCEGSLFPAARVSCVCTFADCTSTMGFHLRSKAGIKCWCSHSRRYSPQRQKVRSSPAAGWVTDWLKGQVNEGIPEDLPLVSEWRNEGTSEWRNKWMKEWRNKWMKK